MEGADLFDSAAQSEAMAAAYSAVQSLLPRDPAARASWKVLFDENRVRDALAGVTPGLAASTVFNGLVEKARSPQWAVFKRHRLLIHVASVGLAVLVSALLQTRPTSTLSRVSTFGMMADVAPAAERIRAAYAARYPGSPLLPRIQEQAAGVAAALAGAERAGEPADAAVKQARLRAAQARFSSLAQLLSPVALLAHSLEKIECKPAVAVSTVA